MANVREPFVHPIPILSLRPTQMTVGMREVKEKRKRWREHRSDKKRAEALGKHMIPVVLGPDERYFVVDHHHLARALHDEGVKDILVTVIGNLSMVDGDAFWGVMDNKRWVYPYDSKGERRHFKDIPKSVADLKDDPFRSLAGELRRAGGFAKDTTPFSEFLWADFLRRRLSRKTVEDNFAKAIEKGLALARGHDAIYLPAPNEDVTLTGRIVGTVTGEPIAGATVTVGTESFVTDDHGVFSLTGTSPDVRDVTIAGAGLVTRVSRVSFADRDVTLDVIQERPPFNLAFFRELGRNAFESTTGLEPLRPIPNAPRVHIRTVDETGQAMDAALLDLVEAALRDVASIWSADRYPLEVVTRGPETKIGQAGWVTVLFSGQSESGGCGRATLGSATGRIELNHLNPGCACGDNVIAPRTVRHELGHIYGYWHTAVRGGVMSNTWTTRQCNSRPSSREIEHAKYMYSRPNGNTDPDTDPVGRVLHTADEIVIED